MFGGIDWIKGPQPNMNIREIVDARIKNNEITVIEKAIYFKSVGEVSTITYELYGNPARCICIYV